MTDVHAQGYLWLYAVTSEMSFPYEETEQKAFLKRIQIERHFRMLSRNCFTVKFPVKRFPVSPSSFP